MPIDLELTPAQRQLKDTSRELAADFAERALQHDAERSLPVENFAALKEAGMYGLVVPEEFGGRGGGALDWLMVAEEIAQGDASTALCFNMHMNATGGICQRPAIDSETKQRVAKLAIEDGDLFCTSVSEPTSSSLLPSTYVPTVIARPVDGGYALSGRKMFASAFEASDYCYTYAHIEGDPSPAGAVGVVIPSDSPGVKVTDVWDTLGMRATRSNQVDFTDVLVPEDLVLYRTDNFVDSFIIQEANYAFGGYTCAYLGLGLGIVQWVSKFLGERVGKGFAQPMGYHPDMSRRVGEMVNAIEGARLLTYQAAWRSDTQPPSPQTFQAWVQAKYAVGRALQEIVSLATVACGVHALFRPLGLERMLRDAHTAPVMPPNEDACAAMIGLLAMGLDPAQAPTLKAAEPAPVG